jgi:hypothetical protein
MLHPVSQYRLPGALFQIIESVITGDELLDTYMPPPPGELLSLPEMVQFCIDGLAPFAT